MNLEKTLVKLNLFVVEKLSTQLLNLKFGVAKHFLGPLHSHVFFLTFLVKSENWRKIIKPGKFIFS